MAKPMVAEGWSEGFQSERLYYIGCSKKNEDIREYLTGHLNDPVNRSLSGGSLLRPESEEGVEKAMEAFASAYFSVAICMKPSELAKTGDEAPQEGPDGRKKKHVVIGTTALGFGGITSSVARHRTAQLGISIARKHNNKGYGSEAVNWVLDWAFQHGGMHTVQLSTPSHNTRAAHVYEKLGFVLEGRRRECFWFNRQWYDDIEFSMTEDDWARIRGISQERA